ncbi:BMP family ABC transporter substrate-binding protein [Borrelia persica]|uniref:BMP family ABC transporter substrate-binding protein n=1 Tax=Borrelia persica TaxID=44448 RepID=UPI0004659A94|nr:BMP family protein [Borrelia persica]
MINLFLILCFLYFSCSASEVDGGTIKVAVLLDGLFNDESFNESAWNGIQKVKKELGLEIIVKESSANSYLSDLNLLKINGSNFIWLIGYRFSDVAVSVALENPGIKYVVIDPVYNTDLSIPKNLSAITFRSEEGAFLVGYIAAKISNTGKIGFLGGMDDVIINAFRYGYEAGVIYANRNISIDNRYIGSFVDAKRGEILANEMYVGGVDIIYHASGLSGLGVIEAAKKFGDGHYVIGVDQDQSHLAPEHVITSSIKDIGRIISILMSNYLKTRAFEGGRLLNYGLKEGLIDFVKNPKKISFKLEKELDEISEKIINGKIVVPNNKDTYHRFQKYFLINTNFD